MKLIALITLAASLAGCSVITPEMIHELKDDHSSITIEINTPWGPQKISRTNPLVKSAEAEMVVAAVREAVKGAK